MSVKKEFLDKVNSLSGELVIAQELVRIPSARDRWFNSVWQFLV
jgi:hypothetical protein